MGDTLGVKLHVQSLLQKSFVRSFLLIGGATACANTIHVWGPFSADLWLGVSIGVLLQIANVCYWSLVFSWAHDRNSEK